jgi:ankyrin repeat protein
LEYVDWARDDVRWYEMLEQPIRSGGHVDCFRLVLSRCDPNLVHPRIGRTILHDVAGARSNVPDEDLVACAVLLLDAGARLDVRDELLRSTPLGWACRWGRVSLVRLLLDRGADPLEADAEPWATPRAWAEKTGQTAVLQMLR